MVEKNIIMNVKQNSLPLAKALDELIARKPAYFCTPGHRFENGISDELKARFGKDIFKYDLTETYGLDDLHEAEDAIKDAQERTARLYGTQHSRFLVNGTTCGNEALILALCKENDEIIISRNCHQSVISGLILSGAKPVYIEPEYDEAFGICNEISKDKVSKAIELHPNAKAVFITSPTYYGRLSDIKSIAGICHKNNIPLLVDEAHGSHLYFSDKLPGGALKNGADGVVMSFHKTIGSMTQSSVLHINSRLIDIDRIDSALKMLMSSSPSYILMTSLDAARLQLENEGQKLIEKAVNLSGRLRTEIKKTCGFKLYEGEAEFTDITRVVLSAAELGISGYALSDILFEDYNICLEMADMSNAVAIVTFGNSERDIESLIAAIRDISNRKQSYKEEISLSKQDISFSHFFEAEPKCMISPRKAYFAEKEIVSLDNACGRICTQSIAPYPPGIPVINPGEMISRDVIDILRYCKENNIRVHSYGMTKDFDITVVK